MAGIERHEILQSNCNYPVKGKKKNQADLNRAEHLLIFLLIFLWIYKNVVAWLQRKLMVRGEGGEE